MVSMVVHVLKDAEQIGKAAAGIFAAQVNVKPDSVVGYATGSTPLPTYTGMAELYKAGAVDFSKMITFNLDEYVGLERDHDQSYYKFMSDNLFSKINVDMKNVHVPYGAAKDLDAECKGYEAAIEAAGGIDLQILGIGSNGHIAFNEPDEDFADITHVVTLTENTINDNKRFFNSADEVPKKALSMGIGSIMRARRIVIICTGANKADAVYDMLNGKISGQNPASSLRMHQDVTVFLDEAAAAKL